VNSFTVFTDVLLKPSDFFKKMPLEDNFIHALIFSIVFLLITILLGDFFETIYVSKYFTIPGTTFIKETFVIFTIDIICIGGNILSFELLGAKGKYKDTFLILAYSTAVLPLEFLPIFPINTIMSIYRIHVCTRGGQFVYNLSYWKSCLIVLIGSFIFPILLAIIIIEITIL
jgi:hypothetical protein